MADQHNLIDLRDSAGNSGQTGADVHHEVDDSRADDPVPDAIRILAEALAGRPEVSARAAPWTRGSEPHSDDGTAIDLEADPPSDTAYPDRAVTDTQETETARPDGARPDTARPDLQNVDSLPRSVRRRIEVPLAEGESVECAIRAVRDGGAEWVLATSHRILVDQPSNRNERGTMSLPYHRTTVAVADDGRLHLQCVEFGRSRSTSFEPESGYSNEVDHLIRKLARG